MRTYAVVVFVVALFLSVAPKAHAAGCGIAEHQMFTCGDDCGEQERGTCFNLLIPYYCSQGFGVCCGTQFQTSNSVFDEQDCGSEAVMGHAAARRPPFSKDFNIDARPDCRGGFVNPSQELVAGNQGSGAHRGTQSAGGGI